MAFTPIDPNKAEVRITGTAPNYGLDFYIPKGERGDVGPVGPTGPATYTNLSVGVVETGPETAGATGPQGLKGDKGDPGGIIAATTLADGTDLNSITDAGSYRFASTGSTTALNYPKTGIGGLLLVLRSSSTIATQTIYPLSNSLLKGVWQRNLVTTWSPWYFMSSSRVDQTAGRAIYEWDDANGREQLIYGDTGWRQVIAVGENATFPNMQAFIRRVNNEVEFTCYETTSAAAVSGAQSLYVVPTGFRYVLGASPAMVPGMVMDSGANLVTTSTMYLASAGTYTVMLKATSGVRHYSTLRWKTMEAWPTSLPGTSYGSIPNA